MKAKIKRITTLIGTLLLAAVLIQGCSDVAGPDSSNSQVLSENSGFAEIGRLSGSLGGDEVTCKTSGSYTLTAGQEFNAGTLSYRIQGKKIYVTFQTTGSWVITETQVYVGDELDTTKNPAPGSFTEGRTHEPPVTEVEYSFNLNQVGLDYGDTIYIIGHAVVAQLEGENLTNEQTAYGGDKEGDSAKWWYYIAEDYKKCSGWGKTQ